MSGRATVQDLLGDDNAPVFRSAPIWLLLSDLWMVMTKVIPHFFNIFLPLPSRRNSFSDITVTGFLFQIILTAWSILLLVPLLLLGIVMGGITPLLVAYTTALPFIWIQGGPLVRIPARDSTVRDSSRRRTSNESWVFINGICTSRSGVELIVKRLETLFQRPIVGILNTTLGPIADLLECVIQRDVNFATQSVRIGYKEVKKRLQDKKIEKVVLICHSQGGIITSVILDQLLDDLPRDEIGKLEVYTFANAANHFSNPALVSTSTLVTNTIRHIEHYANGKDPVSEIGVLAFTPTNSGQQGNSGPEKPSDTPQTFSSPGFRFKGRLFVRWKMSGHLLLSHYLGASSILNTPEARRFSRLRMYIGGASPSD